MPYTLRYDRRCVSHAAAVNLATCLVSDFNISSERTRAWSRFLSSHEFEVLNLFYRLMYCWFRRNWNTWKAPSKFHATPLIQFRLRHAQERNKCALHCTEGVCYKQQIKLHCVNKPLRNTVHRTYGDRIGDVCVTYSGLGHGALGYSEVRLYSHLSKHPVIDKSNIVPNLYVLHSSQTNCCQ